MRFRVDRSTRWPLRSVAVRCRWRGSGGPDHRESRRRLACRPRGRQPPRIASPSSSGTGRYDLVSSRPGWRCRPTPTPHLPQIPGCACVFFANQRGRRPLAVFGIVAFPVPLRLSTSAVLIQRSPPHRHPRRAMLRARPPIEELEMQSLREPAGGPIDQHVQRIASPDPLALHVRA